MTRIETVTIPVAQLAAANEALLLMKAEHPEVVGKTVPADSRTAPHGGDTELKSIEALIEEVADGRQRDESAELAGPPALIREFLWLALVSATDELRDACADYERGHAELERIDASKTSADAWVELFVDFERRDRQLDPSDVGAG